MKKLIAYIHLSRPINLITGLFSVFAGAAILGELGNISMFLTIAIVVVLYNAAANAINDYFDYEIDMVNRPNRPLSKGIISRKEAKIFSIILFTIGSLVSFLLPPFGTFMAIIISMPLMIVYSWELKKLPLVGNVLIAFVLGLAFIFIGVGFGRPSPMILPALLAFGLTLIREVVKDMADIKGDRAGGANTLPDRIGLKKTGIIVFILSLFFGAAIFLPYAYEIYGTGYIVTAFTGVTLPLWVGTTFLLFDPKPKTAHLFSKILKVSTIMGVLAVYLG